MLTSLVFIPLIAAVLVSALGRAWTRRVAAVGTLLPAVPMVLVLRAMDWRDAGAQLRSSWSWLPEMGISFEAGVTPVGALLLALTVLLGPICVFASFTAITKRVRTYYFWLLVLQSAMSGVFIAQDVILFYIFFEFTLVPMFVLISLFGSTNRRAAATKFFLYTFTGSVIALAGLAYVAWWKATQIPAGAFAGAGAWSFDLAGMQMAASQMPLAQQKWVFLALMLGFAVKVPLFPLHTWLPLAHTEAPTAGSVILAGVLLKLGTYGMLVFAIPFCPRAAIEAQTLVGVLAVTGILAAGLICWVQTDVKKLVAYSSVAHLGFCVLGLFAFNPLGLQGAVLYMINHGLSTGALFLCIGMIYERYHTRSMKELGGLAAKMPVWATFMVFFTMASVGLPGTNGFVSEFLCLLGAFQAGPWGASAPGSVAGLSGHYGFWFAAIAGVGMIVAAMYLLYMLGRVVWGPLVEPHGHGGHGGHGDHGHGAATSEAHAPVLPADLTAREIAVLAPIAALCLGLGLYPKILTAPLEASVAQATRQIDAARGRLATEPVREREQAKPTGSPRAAADQGMQP